MRKSIWKNSQESPFATSSSFKEWVGVRQKSYIMEGMKRNGEIFYGLTSVRSVCFQMMYECQWIKNSTLDSQKKTVKHVGGNIMVYGDFSW